MHLVVFHKGNPNNLLGRFSLYSHARAFCASLVEDRYRKDSVVIFDVKEWRVIDSSCSGSGPAFSEGEW